MSIHTAINTKMPGKATRENAHALLQDWLFRQIDKNNRTWFLEQRALLRNNPPRQAFQTTFNLLSRRFTKDTMTLSAQDALLAEACIAGWKPHFWRVVDSARILLLTELTANESEFAPRFQALIQTAEVSEAISLYRGLPLYPDPASLESQVGEGLRSNIHSVFEAIAHHNPYPKHYFTTHRWNQMILKALFISSRLAPIDGLDERANEELAITLLSFARERWAAKRTVPFELWRCVGPFARDSELQELAGVIASGNLLERQAAALAISASAHPNAAEFLKPIPGIAAAIAAGHLTWDVLNADISKN